MAASEIPSDVNLGEIAGTRYSIALTSSPWETDVDTIVVSVGGSLGQLGQALQSEFPNAAWESIPFDKISAGEPQVLPLRALGNSSRLERAVLVTVLDEPGGLGDINDDSLKMAVLSGIATAIDSGAKILGLPLLATGAHSLPRDQVAEILVPTVIGGVQDMSGRKLEALVFVCQTEETAAPIERTFRRLSAAFTPSIELTGGTTTDMVDPNKGLPLTDDCMGTALYVSMLATVLADRDTQLPISVGIFGEWGSGKSHFMAMLRHQVAIVAGADGNRYCDHIAQIGFNAWHYADSNLWASLADEIFRQLAVPESDSDTPKLAEKVRAALTDNLEQRRQLEATVEHARTSAAELQAELDSAIAEQQGKVSNLLVALRKSPKVRKRIDDVWRQLGIEDDITQVKVFQAQLNGTMSEADALGRAATDRNGRRRLIVAVFLLLSGAIAAMALPAARGWLIGIVGVMSLCTGASGVTLLSRARDGFRHLRDIVEDLEAGTMLAGQDAVREKLSVELAELRAAESKQRVAQGQLDDVVARLGELKVQLAGLEPGRRLYAFLADRAHGDSYTRNLGLISTIRKDFQQLVTLLAEARQSPEKWGVSGPPIDRIILYIDDLDRCRPEQVVEVLQAVHLLLAFELFIVVVGVDPRWLLRSLRSQYTGLLHDGQTNPFTDWHTPEDYLEKILNIPLTLPPMPTGSLGRLVRSMVAGATPNMNSATRQARVPRSAGDIGRAPSVRSESILDIGIDPGSEVDSQRRPEIVRQERKPLTEPEITLLAVLEPLIDTPREAKRLINLYRMVRATRDLSDASRFLGIDGRPGEFQAVVILLGLLTAHAKLLSSVLDTPPDPESGVEGGLRYRPVRTTWNQFVADLEPRCANSGWTNATVGPLPEHQLQQWVRLYRGMTAVSAFIDIPDLSSLQTWLPHIRRFSYSMVSTNGSEPEILSQIQHVAT
ncbi:P-loop NTPase fold protein [Nocardia sp. NPDC049737]|uniref:P-loop NTPase fold protein n=1 Tax=Nocardia sp. NPDC049737 TaxID=3154358 RepID=UPI00343DF47A